MRKRRNPETIAGRVSSTGAIVSGSDFNVQRTSTGVFNITLPADFRVLAAAATGGFGTGVDAYSSNGFRVQTYNTVGSLADFPFSFVAAAVTQ